MKFNGRLITDDNRAKYKQYFQYLYELIITTKVELQPTDEIVSNIDYIEYVKHILLDDLLDEKVYKNVIFYKGDISINIQVLSWAMNIEVYSYDAFNRKSIINELL